MGLAGMSVLLQPKDMPVDIRHDAEALTTLILCSTTDRVINQLKQRWVDCGSPANVDWDDLFDGII
jgi:hypothetical protein